MKKYRDMSIEQLVNEHRQEANYIEWLLEARKNARSTSPEYQVSDEELGLACQRLAVVLANLAAKGKRLQREEEHSELPF